MDGLIRVERLGSRLFSLADRLGSRCYLLRGDRRCALVDAMGGAGDVLAAVQGPSCGLPVDVFLTHRHVDHTAGAYRFPRVMMAAEEDGHWDEVERHAAGFHRALAEDPGLPRDVPWALAEGSRPQVDHVGEGDAFDLGAISVRCVSLPGHTAGSMGYLCPELGVLCSGDAVTPVMCLCFEESLPVGAWRETLDKMEGLDFERFYTGHHDLPFGKSDLASFREAADFAEGDRGHAWHHALVPGWEGTCHLCPCPTADVDSRDFRAVITRGLPPRRPRRGR